MKARKLIKYVIIVEKAKKNYSAYAPDLPGCVATTKTVEETVGRMKEAIEFHLGGVKEAGLSIHQAHSSRQIRGNRCLGLLRLLWHPNDRFILEPR